MLRWRPSDDPIRLTYVKAEPTLEDPVWQMCTASQFEGPAYSEAVRVLHLPPHDKHRKLWEWAYIRSVLLSQLGSLEGKRGLGFGVGREPLVASFAGTGASIVATDLNEEDSASRGWIDSNQHSASLDSLRHPDHCSDEVFDRNVIFRAVNMNNIPNDLRDFDFLWSSCSLEHLGSLKNGLDFVRSSMKCLKKGGVAVHTTEFNLSNLFTLETRQLSLYRRKDIEGLANSLVEAGHTIPPLNFNPGNSALDKYIDLPPYQKNRHLKLRVSFFKTTSFGLTVKAG